MKGSRHMEAKATQTQSAENISAEAFISLTSWRRILTNLDLKTAQDVANATRSLIMLTNSVFPDRLWPSFMHGDSDLKALSWNAAHYPSIAAHLITFLTRDRDHMITWESPPSLNPLTSITKAPNVRDWQNSYYSSISPNISTPLLTFFFLYHKSSKKNELDGKGREERKGCRTRKLSLEDSRTVAGGDGQYD
jgi:hypothetical protein